jgi:hypothetical protein
MSRHRMFDWIVFVSQIGMLICFGVTICLEIIGSDRPKRIVGIFSAVFLIGMAVAFVVCLWDIAKRRFCK